MTANIVSLTQYPKRGEPGIQLAKMELLAGIGVRGDSHRGGDRQVSILLAEAVDWMDAQPENGLCAGRFRENIRITGLSPEVIQSGCSLLIGDTVLQITAASKYCFDQCRFYSEETVCYFSKGALFATVVQSGEIRIGDAVFLT